MDTLTFIAKGIAKLGAADLQALPEQAAPSVQPPLREPIAKLAETSPRAAVIEAWRDLSSAVTSAVRQSGEQLPRVIPNTMVEDRLERRGLLNSQQVSLLRQLRNLRNTAVHGPAFRMTAGKALQYALTASRLAAALARNASR